MKLRSHLTLVGVVSCLQLLACCAPKDEPTPAAQAGSEKEKVPAESSAESRAVEGQKPIGSATMDEDGTIHLMLRAESREKAEHALGDAKIIYRKDDADYQRILDHLGGMRPGESKPVPPFPDKER